MAGSSRSGTPRAVKFVGHDAAGLPVKRKQVHQACLPCRKRKKRCHHVQDATTAHSSREDPEDPEDPDHTSALDHEAPSRRETRSTRGQGGSRGSGPDRDTSDAAAQLLRFFHHAADTTPSSSPDNDPRRQMSPAPAFLGDLNPEGILVEATMAPAQKTAQTDKDSGHQVIGFVLPASPRQSRGAPVPERRTGDATSPTLVDSPVHSTLADDTPGPFFSIPRGDGTRLTIPVQDTAKFAALAQTLVNRGLADKVMPSDAEWRALRDLYLAKIHPIFPIYDESTLLELPEDAGLRELIQASVCLAAATDPEARGFLSFKSPVEPKSQPTVSFDEYSREMADFINRRLAELQESHEIPLAHQIQVMALTCLYWQPASPTERFEPLSLYAKLVSLIHTHGLHLGVSARVQTKHGAEGGGSRIFKCVYALDRLMGTISARPVMFHNVDLMEMPRPDPHDPPIFKLFMALILILDQVIEMYRPRPSVSYVDIPVLEGMVLEAGAQFEPENLLATLEVLYHAIGVLSVRMPRHRFRAAPECDTLTGPRTQHLPPSSVNARRSHSTDRILDGIRGYKLSPMPFIPYALTLSLSVAYRKWRFSRLPMFRARGGADFKRVLPALQDMGAIWSSARINGQLGQAVMLKLDRNEVLNRKRTEAKRGQTGTLHDGDVQQVPVEPQLRGETDTHQTNIAPSSDRTTTAPDAPSNLSLPDSTNPNQPTIPRFLVPDTTPSQPPLQPLVPPWPATWPAGTTPTTTTTADPTQQAPPQIPLDDAIPIPNTLLPIPQPAGTGPGVTVLPTTTNTNTTNTAVSASSEANTLNDFLVNDDDVLFSAWDPGFAQSVDFSFSSILDPGNPFAWPEYSGCVGLGGGPGGYEG